MRRLFRLALYLFIVVVVLGVAAVLLRNTIAKETIESRLRTNTGMDVRIGLVDIGLLSPTVTFENVKLYNTPEFGGGIFIDMPELHMEYDPRAMRSGALHFKLVRLDLAEVAVVQDKKGRVNMKELNKKNREASHEKKSSGNDWKFTGIDTLNLTLGKFRLSNLASGRQEEVEFGIKNQITTNVTSETNLTALNVLLFTHAASASSAPNPTIDISSLLQSLFGH
jgi:uncharacterized protein involved in outer membrane biogenesis